MRIKPHLLAWVYLFVNHDFNKVLLASAVTKVIFHSKSNQRKRWEFHKEQGWYVGPAPDHYRYITYYILKTHREQITDMAQFIPNNILIPNAALENLLRRTIRDSIHLLHHKLEVLVQMAPNTTKSALLDIKKY